MGVPSVNVNKVCFSGLNAIYLAHQMIMSGDADIVVAGGMESTTIPAPPAGARADIATPPNLDAIIKDGLWCAFDACLMVPEPSNMQTVQLLEPNKIELLLRHMNEQQTQRERSARR